MLPDLCPVGKNQFQTHFFFPKNQKHQEKIKMPIFYCGLYFSIVFSQISYFFSTVIFYFFLAFMVLNGENQTCLKFIFYLLGTSLGAFLCYLNGTCLTFRTQILHEYFCLSPL